jgi:hypothetical protein
MVGKSSSGNHNSKDYGLLLYMRAELLQAHAQLMANRQLSRSNAGLLALTEGLHELGCLDKEQYEACKELYSRKMVFSLVAERSRPKTVEAVQEQSTISKLEAEFSSAVTNWPLMKEKARIFMLKKAEKWKDKVPSAQMLLELAAEEPGSVHQETLSPSG